MKKIFGKLSVAAMVALLAFGSAYGATKASTVKTVPAATKKTAPTKQALVGKTRIRKYEIGDKGPADGFIFKENPNYAKDGWRYLEAYWDKDLFNVKYEDGEKRVSKLNQGNKSDWYVPSATELNELISALSYPNGTLPPGKYFSVGGKTSGVNFDLKTKSRTIGKLPARFNAPSSKKIKASSKLAALETKRQATPLGNIVAVRKVTVKEITTTGSLANIVRMKGLGKKLPSITGTQQDKQEQQEIAQEVQQSEEPSAQTPQSATAFTASSHPASRPDYSAIDNYALNLNIPESMSLEDAARKICQTARNEKEKARAIFAWIGYNIAYDFETRNGNFTESEKREIGIYDADKTYERRMGVCEGYSRLFVKMAQTVGLNSEYRSGLAKLDDYVYSSNPEFGNHGWTEVQVNGEKILLDVTWGAAYSQNSTEAPELKDEWFDCDPAIFVFTHFPAPRNSNNQRVANPSQQLLSKPISEDMFKVMPGVYPNYTKVGLKGQELINFLKTHPKSWNVKFYSTPVENAVKNGFKINKMEFSDQIVVGENCKFNFTVPAGIVWAKFNGTDLGDVTSGKDFEISCLQPGTVTFYYALPGENRGWSILSYNVTSSRSAPQENASRTAFASY